MNGNVFLLLGSNLDDPEKNLLLTIKKINELAGRVDKMSSIYSTEPWGVRDQPEFLNQVVKIETDFPPQTLLNVLQEIESQIGRRKAGKWGPRKIDIDILFYNSLITEGPTLTIPHPGIPDRRFTLVPLSEIAPRFRHPKLHLTCQQLLLECKDPSRVVKFTAGSSPQQTAQSF